MVACHRPKPFSTSGLAWIVVCSGTVTPWHALPDAVLALHAIITLTSTPTRRSDIVCSSYKTVLYAHHTGPRPWSGLWPSAVRRPCPGVDPVGSTRDRHGPSL